MYLVLTPDDFNTLSDATRAELIAKLFPGGPKSIPQGLPASLTDEEFKLVVDLSPGQVEEFMKGCAPETIAGLEVFAQHGPVIHAALLDAAGIENYSHFQSRVTKRTRTITGKKGVFLFAWDDWSEHDDGIGFYAVTPATFRSLRIFFKLD